MKTKARVTVTLEIQVDDTWSEDTTLVQVQKQSKESAEFIIDSLIRKEPRVCTVGKLKSTIVMLEE